MARPAHERRTFVEQACAGDEEMLAEVAEVPFHRAELYRSQRDVEAAARLYRTALGQQWQFFSETHPDVLATMEGLGLALRDLGQPDSAEVLIRQVLDPRRRQPEPDEAALIANAASLAYIYRMQERWSEAEKLYRDVLARQRRRLGPRHQDVAATLNNLGYLLRLKQQYAEAAACYEEALSIHRDVYGEAHPTTQLCRAREGSRGLGRISHPTSRAP